MGVWEGVVGGSVGGCGRLECGKVWECGRMWEGVWKVKGRRWECGKWRHGSRNERTGCKYTHTHTHTHTHYTHTLHTHTTHTHYTHTHTTHTHTTHTHYTHTNFLISDRFLKSSSACISPLVHMVVLQDEGIRYGERASRYSLTSVENIT